MAPQPDKRGYLRVGLTKRPKQKRCYAWVHRLVLEAFVGPRPRGHETDHKDQVTDNNRCMNLQWVTKRENVRLRGIRGGTVRGDRHFVRQHPEVVRGVNNGRAILTEADVLSIRRLVRPKGRLTQARAAEIFGVKETTIWKIIARRLWKHLCPPNTPTSQQPVVALA
jgi:hypothetical protein